MSFGCDVGRNRSALVCEAIRATDADVLVSWDPDVEFEQHHLDAIVERARETRGICGGLYSHVATMYNFAPDGAHTLPANESRSGIFRIGPAAPNKPMLVDAVGTGFLAAHRSVYERTLRVHPELRLVNQSSSAHWYYQRMVPAVGGMHCLSSDYSFCSYARDSGVPVEILPNVVLGHRNQPWWQPLGREPECGYATIKITSHGFRRPSLAQRIRAMFRSALLTRRD